MLLAISVVGGLAMYWGLFVGGDNAFVDSDVSSDGHRWLVGVAPDEPIFATVDGTAFSGTTGASTMRSWPSDDRRHHGDGLLA